MKSMRDLLPDTDAKSLTLDERKERAEIKAKTYNDTVGNLTECDCELCKNKGYIQKVRYEELYNDFVVYMKPCECMKKREIIRKAMASGLGEYIHKRFDDYIATDEWQKNIKAKAIDYVKSNNDNWFVALGQSGCGKTLICSIVANYMLGDGKTVTYITWTDFISKLKRDMMADNQEEVSRYLESIKNVDVLFIDELLKKYNETDLKYIIEIINYRYTNDLRTIITSERTINELLDIDEATFSRMIEKSKKYIINIPKDRMKNYRLRALYEEK